MLEIKATVLKHKTLKGVHGMIHEGMLLPSGSGLVPQLYPEYADKKWLTRALEFPIGLGDYDVINVNVSYLNVKEG